MPPRIRRGLAVAGAAILLTGSAGSALLPLQVWGAPPCGPPVQSVIACENSLAGDPTSDWQVTGNGSSSIQGYAASMSVNPGDTVNFKVTTPASSYYLDILRLGYYQGNGARKLVSRLRPSAHLPQTQPSCLTNSATGLIDCGNWAVSASWSVPTTAVSGVYIVHLVRDDATAGDSQIFFVVRNDASTSDILYQTSDTTWAAYDTYGGNSLYSCTVACPPGNPQAYKGAFKVSYNRPFTPAADLGRASIYYAEYPLIRFLEANGYDVSYTTGADVDLRGALLRNHKVFVSAGHDEYWSANQRANVEAARDAGVNLAFFSGNEVFWKTRWEPSIDGSNTPQRTLVSYKETHFNAPTDPQDPPTWTGSWRDPRFSPPADGGRAENALTGQFFIVNAGTSDIQVPAQYGALRLWRNTAAARLSSGQILTLGATIGTLGYEWDEEVDNGFRPAGLFDLSSTTVSGVETFVDYGSSTATGTTATHHLSLYRAPGGALVFGAGTVQWSWGLDSTNPSGHAPDLNMQQATVNLMADMGAQPYALLAGLQTATSSTDFTPPSSIVTSPASGSSLADGARVTISGTAADSGGGVVAGVEVSTDGGSTWHPATGTTSWSYSWVAHGAPTTGIKSRAVDDSGNLETPSSGISVSVTCPCSIWGANVTPATPDGGDASAIEVGVKFTSDIYGTVSGIRFYKASANSGTHIGNLWSAGGQLLGTVTFIGESASGWQQANFAQPAVILPNTTYVASYFAPRGHYASDVAYFYPHPSPQPDGDSLVDSPPLHALRSGASLNGVYKYSSSSTFPNNFYFSENYWVDVAFSPSPPPGTPTNVTATGGYSSAGVSWTAPSSGGPASTYTVTPYIGSAAQPATLVNGTPAPTSTTVTGLANGTTYTFTVTASNPNGAGSASSPSNAVTPSATASVVINGGFENGLGPWTPSGLPPPSLSTTRAHSGTTSALVGTVQPGAEPLGNSSLTQTITVPPGTSTLTFWYWPATTDDLCSGSGCVYDWQEAQIRNTSGGTLASIFKSNSNAQAWTQVTFNTTPYAGQTIVLWFNVHEDGSSPPDDCWMYLDDVSLAAAGATVPGAPTNVTATAGNAQASVTWLAPSNGGSPITAYTITPYIGTAAQTATTITGSPPGTSTTISGLTNGTTYTFRVSATNGVGTGAPSAQSNAVTPVAPTAPGPPTNAAAVAGDSQATVSWSPPASNGGSAITGYTVTSSPGAVTASAGPLATSVVVAPLVNGTTYTFTVTATNAIGTSIPSAPSNAVTPTGPTAPGPPTNVAAVAGNAQATVSWAAPVSNGGSPITGFIVTSSPDGVTASASATATSAVVGPLVNGTTYTFTVTAANAVGTSSPSAPSNAVTPVAPTAPGPPTNASALAGNAQVTVSWTAPASNGGSAITGFTVTSSPDGVTASASAAATSAVVSPLVNGTTYTFTVTATNAIGTSSPSSPSNAVTPSAPTAPGPPTNVTAVAGNAQATVSWTPPASNGGSAITGFTVTSSPGGVTANAGASATSAVVTSLVNGTTYTFTVTATNAVGTSVPSASSNSVTPSGPAMAFVQQVSAHSFTSGSISVTPATNLTTGNRLIVLVGVWNYGHPTTQTVTDSAGNTYTELLHFVASEGTEESVWSAPITSGGGTRPSITAAPTANADVGIVVLEYAGLSTVSGAGAVDRIAQATGTTGAAATVRSGATAATTAANELAVGFYVDSGFGDTLSYGSGFTGRTNVSPTGDMELGVEDQFVGLGATPNAAFGTGASTTWLVATVVFKAGP